MQSADSTRADAEKAADISLKATLLIAAIIINALEFFLPRIPFLPWLKPGLANCITVAWIIRFGALDALLLTMLRVWTVGFYFGFSFITMALGLTGGLLATLVMGAVWNLLGTRGMIGTVGLGIIGAACHNCGQLGMVYILMATNFYLLYQIPFMFVASILFGGLVGIIAPYLLTIIDQSNDTFATAAFNVPRQHVITLKNIIASSLVFTFCIALVVINAYYLLIPVALAVTVIVQLLLSGSVRVLVAPLYRFWILFLFVGCMYGFFTPGKRVLWLPLVTFDGLDLAARQWLRIWTWLQITHIFTRLKFHTLVFGVMQAIFPGRRYTLYAGLLALEDFPVLFNLVRNRLGPTMRDMLRHPIATARLAVSATFEDVMHHVIKRGNDSAEKERD
ncbi:MAG: hypothetical protein GF398_15555 [Chitinivibrionales bacterium]|nr:hypothetical protein [Chitinivibrionales bacterium]